MRLVVLTLLLANVLFLGWQYLEQENRPKASRDAYQDVPTLELTSREAPVELAPVTQPDIEMGQEAVDPVSAESSPALDDLAIAEAQTLPVEPPTPSVCANLGPFDSEAAARAAIEKFSLSSFDPVVNKRQVPRRSYWVYIPPFRDRKSANLALEMLATRGIKDAYVVGSGEDRNAIALGLYSQQASAQRRLQQLEKTGMAARVGEIDQTNDVFFIGVELPRLEDFDAGLLDSSGNSTLSFAATECEVEVQDDKADAN